METKTTLTKANTTNTSKLSNNNKRYLAKLWSKMAIAFMCVMALGGQAITAFAVDSDAGSFDTVVSFIVTWVQRIGGVIGFIGAIQFGMAFKNDDADGKTRGLMTLASGFIVIAVCIAYDTLFKQA